MLENKFYKVNQSGGTYITATFYNPITGETKTQCVRDYDYSDCSRDNDELYYMDIDEDARTEYLHSLGVILVGDVIEVIKGRTIPHGYIGTVVNKRDYKDRYGRYIATYIYFEDGQKINVDNCKRIED